MHVKSIVFSGINGAPSASYKLQSLPIKEEVVISKSIEFFHDPEPCFIHRGAVITRLIGEMDEYFYGFVREGRYEIRWEDFPDRFKNMLELGKAVERILLKV